MTATTLEKVLRFGSLLLPFPAQDMDAREAMRLYAPNYPALEHATVGEGVPAGGHLVFEVNKAPLKTKG